MAGRDEITGWFAGRIPQDWFTGTPEVRVDREEMWVIGTLPDVQLGKDVTPDGVAAARQGRIKQFREQTRDARIEISEEAQKRFGRSTAWGVKIGETTEMFTHLALPVMTRLRLPERDILDTLINSGVARNRAHALAWCVRLVERNEKEWLTELREAIAKVGQVRNQGPLN
ncbi:MAG: hypothetical protein AUH85_16850 [Chloroflexi bacterium 13_1_40CM_4_68_4]|nr:MAG: hypothetical protein AUH85_16850 [Chloroflexi bacterium 13_1_40CM_4_68_4]